jgi:hypothetical protein
MKALKTYSAITLAAMVCCLLAPFNCIRANNNHSAMNQSYTSLDTIDGQLLLVTPHNFNLEFTTGICPDEGDSSIILCTEAAFTSQILDHFIESNIVGTHLSHGIIEPGPRDPVVDGSFACINGKCYFHQGEDLQLARQAKSMGGVFFMQNIIICNGVEITQNRMYANRPNKIEIFRCLCEYNGKLCIIQSLAEQPYAAFVAALMKAKVTNAMYLDMGGGWNYSWYRDCQGCLTRFFEKFNPSYQTNWIVFRKSM